MANITNKIFVDKMGGRQAQNYIGLAGEIFYDPKTGALRLSDGVTPGGKSITESSPLESLYKGDWVYFVRPDEQEDVMDHIAPNLILARRDGGSLYNAYDQEDGYELNNPSGTEWNTDGWADFSDVKTRYYDSLSNARDGGGWASTKHEFVMHDTNNDKYYAIRFLAWDGGDNNATGAFSYIRREINTDIYFSRGDTNDQSEALNNGDQIADHLVITRGNGQAIFNYAEGIVGDWTLFTLADIGETATWVDNTISFDMPESGTLIAGLEFLKVGDNVYVEFDGQGNGSSVEVTSAYNPVTHSFTVGWAPNAPGVSINPQFIWMNVPVQGNLETGYDNDVSPIGTLWNQDGWDDLTNLTDRYWMTFHDLTNGESLGMRIVGREYIMHDTVADEYYAIKFTRWQQGSEANNVDYPGFSYIRRKIDTAKLSAGLKFNDGTVQNTAYSYKNAAILKRANASSTTYRYLTPDDIGKVVYFDGTAGANSLRIPDAGAAEFPIGTTVTIINRSGGTIFVTKENNDENGTIYGAGTSDSATSWQVPDAGGGNIAVLIKIGTGMDGYFNDWMLSGSGIAVD